MGISRSENMRRIRSSDTEPEMLLRRRLHSAGVRYRVRYSRLIGKPDIVVACYKVAIFVHGCFWHRHEGCQRATFPKTNISYWREKFKRNIERDARVESALRQAGWTVVV